MGPLRPNHPSAAVADYLAANERVVLEMKQHWARILPPILSCLTGLVLAIAAGLMAPAWMGVVANAAWWIWLVLVGHLLYRIYEWYDETFVITNKRLVLVHGIVVKKVAMMPLSKVTDMSYNRSLAARLLGYGTFKIESAGQEQALSAIDFVSDPDATYRDLCGLIFGLDDEDDDRHGEHGGYDRRYDEDEAYSVDGSSPGRSYVAYDEPEFVDDAWPDDSAHHAEWDDDLTDPHGYQVVSFPSPPERHADPYSDDMRRGSHPITHDESPDDLAWSVSREHATAPQIVTQSRNSGVRSNRRDAP